MRMKIIWSPRYRIDLFIISMVFLCLTGCGTLKQIRPEIKFYALEYDSPRLEKPPSTSRTAEILPFTATAFYQTHRIVYREAPYKRNVYHYHQWQEPPAELVSKLLLRDLSNSGLFEAISDRSIGYPADFTLKGSVDDFLQWDIDNRWNAVIAVTVTVYPNATLSEAGLKPFRKPYRITEPCSHNNPTSLAEAMSRAMSALTSQVITDLLHYVNQE